MWRVQICFEGFSIKRNQTYMCGSLGKSALSVQLGSANSTVAKSGLTV
jgi:hypothetical protein